MLARSFVFSTLAALALAACGGGAAAGQPHGKWKLDKDSFVESGVKALRESGKIPAGAEELARGMLRMCEFDLDLASDGTWTAHMSSPQESHDYRGTWTATGDQILIEQTHEDDDEVSDRLSGKIASDSLELDHLEDGMNMRYSMRRVATPASPR